MLKVQFLCWLFLLLICAQNQLLNDIDCNKSKICFIPDDNNQMGVALKLIENDQLEIELFSSVSGNNSDGKYVAVGFSDDDQMGNEPVVECSSLVSQPLSMKISYDKAKSNSRVNGDHGINEITSKLENGKLYCKGVVSLQNKDLKLSISSTYYLLLANGETTEKGLKYHNPRRRAVSGPIILKNQNVEEISNVSTTTEKLTENDSTNNKNIANETDHADIEDLMGLFNVNECEKSKSCFIPKDCENDCNGMMASWKFEGENYLRVELSAELPDPGSYVALGFSETGSMFPAPVIDCTSFGNNQYTLGYSFNPSTSNERPTVINNNYIGNSKSIFSNGIVYCSGYFNVSGVNSSDPSIFKYDSEKQYHIILANGKTDPVNKRINYHLTQRSVSPKMKLNEIQPESTTKESVITTTMEQPVPPPPNGKNTFDSTSCGKAKGCFKATDSLTVAYRLIENDEYMIIELVSKQKSPNHVYAAVGFGTNGQMSPAHVVECSAIGNEPLTMKFSINDGYNNERIENEPKIRKKYLTNTEISYVDGEIYCKGTVKVQGVDNNMIFQYNPGQEYRLIAAEGKTREEGLTQHTQRSSSDALKLDEYENHNGGTSNTKLIIAHAILMVIAWIILVPTAVLFARLLRSSWPTVKPGGILIWFHVHRTLNFLAILCMIAAFVCILTFKNWKFENPLNGWGGAHSIIGLIAIILSWLQPFIASFRCSPDNPRRPIFNWIHRFIGVTSMILATTAICIASIHFTSNNNSAQFILTLVPLSLLCLMSLVFLVFNRKVAEVNVKSLKKENVDGIPMQPIMKDNGSKTWSINYPNTNSDNAEKLRKNKNKSSNVNRVREISVYAAVLAFVSVGVALSVLFALGI